MLETKSAKQDKYELNSGATQFTFLNTGDLFKASSGHIMLNQVLGNSVDGSLNNLYLRVFQDNGDIRSIPLLGIDSNSQFSIGEKQARWEGVFEEIQYEVTFTLTENNSWFWHIEVEGSGQQVDVLYGYDVGLAPQGALQSNEAYVSQYIDHKVFDETNGFVVCSRQNQSEEIFPYLQQGSLTKNTGYSTDGFQFFGTTYKETNKPAALQKDHLDNEVYQYEFGYTALQSEKVTLLDKKEFVFYGLFKENHPDAITKLQYRHEIEKEWEKIKKEETLVILPKITRSQKIGKPLEVVDLTNDEVADLYPKRLQEEQDKKELLSFFTETYEHVVLKAKDVLLERSHGQILFTGNKLTIDEPIMSTTSWMVGVFNSQVVLGNTSMNKLLTNTRNHLNILKTSGQRIYVKIDQHYRLLTMPSLFEIGFNYAKWIYKTKEETFIVKNYTSSESEEVKLTVQSESGNEYAYIVTNQVVLNDTEYQVPFDVTVEENKLIFKPDSKSVVSNIYPNLSYQMTIKDADANVSNGSILLEGTEENTTSLVALDIKPTNRFSITIQGSFQGTSYEEKIKDFETEKQAYKSFFSKVMRDFELSIDREDQQEEVEKMNLTTWWYTHNMFVHYLAPHGLEQYGGAAWGTRDVAQGPAEYFMAMKQFDVVKSIIKKLFSHQFVEDGNWPQWFMFDNYSHIHAGESHGDIIVWPLKLLSDYLIATNDLPILEEEIPYISNETHSFTDYKETLYKHVEKEIDYIKNNFLEGTYLSSYGDGDWDDTLQPYDQKLRKHMASSWTVALTYQTLKQFAYAIKEKDSDKSTELAKLVDNLYSDFHKLILSDDVIPGFVYMENADSIEFMIHPKDEKTGINYRLLPMTRSMISELFSPEQAKTHYELIKEELYYPDGVRLMNRPATYHGGVSSNFKRAEQAANFGREIGLLYIHAHIRYVEAMAKIGEVDETWDALHKINPINIQKVVPGAQSRQSNAYFSSSDAMFNTRYEAQENYEKLKSGEVNVKGGWRIYSSGPGIYLNQLISNVLGVRTKQQNLVIDPTLPKKLDGLTLKMAYEQKPVSYHYHLSGEETPKVIVNGEELSIVEEDNAYRKGGWILPKEELEKVLHDSKNDIDIYV